MSIGKRGVNIRIPSFLAEEERTRHLERMKAWAIRKLKEKPPRQEAYREYKDGDILKVGDEEFRLEINYKDKQGSSGHIAESDIRLIISSGLSEESRKKHIATLLSRCIAAQRLPRLKERIHDLNARHFNQKINKIFFKHNKSNWGSCSSAGNINISTRLLFAPDYVLEYVCIHELAHLIESNHSRRFWTLVQKAMPDYKDKIKWLKENRDKCRF